jgi:hypothetical protein
MAQHYPTKILLADFELNTAANGVYQKISFRSVYVNTSSENFSFCKSNGVWELRDNADTICQAVEGPEEGRPLHEITRWCNITGGFPRPIKMTITPCKTPHDPPELQPYLATETMCRSEGSFYVSTRGGESEPLLITHAHASQDYVFTEANFATVFSGKDAIDACKAIILQFQQAPALRGAIQLRDNLQAQLATLKTAKNTNFPEIARVGVAFKPAVAACKQLAEAEEYDTVTVLGAKLKELKALDVSSLPPPGCSPPAYVTYYTDPDPRSSNSATSSLCSSPRHPTRGQRLSAGMHWSGNTRLCWLRSPILKPWGMWARHAKQPSPR